MTTPLHVTEWEIFDVRGPGGGLYLMTEAPWGAEWLAGMMHGRDCITCGRPLAFATSWKAAPAFVAAVQVGGDADGTVRMLTVTMCGQCAAEHPTSASAGNVMCVKAAEVMGATEARTITPMPAHKVPQ